jgi:hypothetical protein
MRDGRPWKVHVDVPGRQLTVLPIDVPTPEEALAEAKTLVRETIALTEPEGAIVYTISVFPSGYRRGDESLVAEEITLITSRRP